MLQNNSYAVNKRRLEIMVLLARRTVELTLNTIDDGILSNIKDSASGKEFNKNVKEIIKNKLRTKYDI